MCGIVGAIGDRSIGAVEIELGCAALLHRGPDDGGVWADAEHAVAIGMRRLAILELSSAGHQPMASACGRYRMVFNGEVYNHADLRAQLPPQAWRGRSDSETLLACFATWGVARTLGAAVGMFAIALYDREARSLTLARDRFGEKPLYYGFVGRAIAFASELKALRALPGFDATIDRRAVAAFIRLGHVPAPRSIHATIAKLSPGSWTTIDVTDLAARRLPAVHRYWSPSEVARAAASAPTALSLEESVIELERRLGDSVRRQMLADVPLGALLSGGIDSSTVVALMQANARQPVKTFTVGFHEDDYDESVHARAVARHLGTDHTELIVDPATALTVVPRLPQMYDEPFADASQLPTALVMAMARRHVKVALSGDGGDELFAGYNRHHVAARHWPWLQACPRPLRRMAASIIRTRAPDDWTSSMSGPARALGVGPRGSIGDRLHRIAAALESRDGQDLYRNLTTRWSGDQIVLDVEPGDDGDVRSWPDLDGLVSNMMLLDTEGYLPDDVLVKVDRAAMAVSLETRAPFLDPDVFEFAWRLPMARKLRGGEGKWILRRVLDRHVPRELVERPKMGFEVPLGSWLRGPLRAWAEELLDERRLREGGYFESALVRSRWHEHLAGRRNWQQELWHVLMFQSWLAVQPAGVAAP